MMTTGADNEDQENDRFPKRVEDPKRASDNRNKGPRDQQDEGRKRRPDDHIAALDRPPSGKKLSSQEQFEKLLHKRCPFHPNGKYSAKECRNLQKQSATSSLKTKAKPKRTTTKMRTRMKQKKHRISRG